MKKITSYNIFVDLTIYSPPSDKKYFNNKSEFIPEISICDDYGNFHIWKDQDVYVLGVEIYPIHFLDYPSNEARQVQHIHPITKEKYETYNNLSF